MEVFSIDSVDLVKLMKKAAVEAVQGTKPMTVVYGKVTSTLPLSIKVDQRMTLTNLQLELLSSVTDYEVKMVENGGVERVVTVKNALVVGDEVAMVRAQGGQKFIVLDKIRK